MPRGGITGGYPVEGSTEPFGRGFASLFAGRFYGHKDPARKQLDDAEAAWIAGFVQAAERSVAAPDRSWRSVVDEGAAVDYLLLQELFKNYDAFRRSVFLTKGSDRALELGPIWDLDRSMGLDLAGSPVGVHGWITAGVGRGAGAAAAGMAGRPCALDRRERRGARRGRRRPDRRAESAQSCDEAVLSRHRGPA